jgi:hypothetical protein
VRSLRNLGSAPAALPILADDVLEFHAARLLLLFKLCGTAGRIDGLTKMAKLDFFARYPQFYRVVSNQQDSDPDAKAQSAVESGMIRYRYGPWDLRYYHVLSYLEAKGLLRVTRTATSYVLSLTETGSKAAKQLAEDKSYVRIVEHMKSVKKVLGSKSGSKLKKMIYDTFSEEVATRAIGERIE